MRITVETLDVASIDTLAWLVAPFGVVEAVPRGGCRLPRRYAAIVAPSQHPTNFDLGLRCRRQTLYPSQQMEEAMARGGHVTANLGRFLKGLDFPAKQTDLVERAKENGADQGVLEVLSNMPSRAEASPT